MLASCDFLIWSHNYWVGYSLLSFLEYSICVDSALEYNPLLTRAELGRSHQEVVAAGTAWLGGGRLVWRFPGKLCTSSTWFALKMKQDRCLVVHYQIPLTFPCSVFIPNSALTIINSVAHILPDFWFLHSLVKCPENCLEGIFFQVSSSQLTFTCLSAGCFPIWTKIEELSHRNILVFF